MQRTLPPAKKVLGDTYEITVDDVKYFPHAGEWVEFVAGSSVDEMLLSLKFQRLNAKAAEEATIETMEELSKTLDEILMTLVRGILSWKWTTARGENLQSPPQLYELRQVELGEIMWLVGQKTNRINDDERKNDSSPSTSPSTVEKRNRQKSG